MAGLLAWAADVVGGGGGSNDEDEKNGFPVVFTPEQQNYARELDRKAASLTRSIQDLRLRIPPPDISQRLPHIHAHNIASNADLALQLNAHSATREQAQLREITLQEENAAFEKAISNCAKKMQEKLQEAEILQSKLKEMDVTEKHLRAELDKTQATLEVGHSGESLINPKTTPTIQDEIEASKTVLLEKLENKKTELSSMEDMVQDLEKKWVVIQHNSLRQPSPAQREKILDKQLYSLIEQLAAKQAQAEALVNEIHVKEQEFDKLNGLWKGHELNTARNRFGKSISARESSSLGLIHDTHSKPPHIGGRTESQRRVMLLRSAFVLYILVLHVLVFIKISV